MSIHSIHFINPERATRRQYVEMGILIVLSLIAVGFIWWVQNGYTTNFLETLK